MNTIIIQALSFAAYKHRHQNRHYPDGTAVPYLNHCIDVMNILAIEAGIDDADILAAALLHDTVEDTDTTPDEIQEFFGDKIASIVAEVTDDKSLPKQTRKQLQIDKAADASLEAKMVKLADKISNVREIYHGHFPPHWDQERADIYTSWATTVVDRIRGTHTQLSALEKLYDNIFHN